MPRRSRATARYPASARAVIWWRQAHQYSGQPCTSSTSGPSPASAMWKRAPLAARSRCVHGPAERTLQAGYVPAAPELAGDEQAVSLWRVEGGLRVLVVPADAWVGARR